MPMTDPAERRQRVEALAASWSQVSRQHLSAGGGCGCGFGGLVLQASDFELDIVEFLLNDARKAGATHVEPFVTAAASRGPDRYSLPALLDAIATTQDTAMIESGDLDFAIARLANTISSIATAHRTSRFACN